MLARCIPGHAIQYFFNRFLCCFLVETTLALEESAILYCLFYLLHNANLDSEYMFIGYGQKLKHIGFRSLPLFFFGFVWYGSIDEKDVFKYMCLKEFF